MPELAERVGSYVVAEDGPQRIVIERRRSVNPTMWWLTHTEPGKRLLRRIVPPSALPRELREPEPEPELTLVRAPSALPRELREPEPEPELTLVRATSKMQAELVARKMGLSRDRWFYVGHPHDVRGRRPTRILWAFPDTRFDQRQALVDADLERLAARHGIQIETVET